MEDSLFEENSPSKKKIALDSLINSISLSLKETILLITIVLTVAGSAWYYRDKINTLEEKVIILEQSKEKSSDYANNVAVLEVKVKALEEDFATVTSDLEELFRVSENHVETKRFNRVIKRISQMIDKIKQGTGLKFENELE